MPHAPAPHLARTSAAVSAVAAARPESRSLLALILALLLRLFARKQVAWSLLEDDSLYDHVFLYDAREHAVTDFDAYAVLGADPYALYPRPMGRAPHAACIEAGLVPDWILPGIRNRGIRPRARTSPMPRHALQARAPPARNITTSLNLPSGSGALTHAHINCAIETNDRH